MNFFTRSTSTWFSNLPSYLNVVPTTAPSAIDNCSLKLVKLTPVLTSRIVLGTASFTRINNCTSVLAPAVNQDTHSASGLLLNTVDAAILSISRSAKYAADSGTTLYNNLTFCAPIRC